MADGTELGRGIKKKLAKAKEQAYTELYVPREQQKQRYLFEWDYAVLPARPVPWSPSRNYVA